MAKLRAEVAAQVAAQLTVARMSLISGVLASRVPGSPVEIADRVVEDVFLHYLAFASDIDPKSVEVGGTLDLLQASILPETAKG